jgi:hypothetical protein
VNNAYVDRFYVWTALTRATDLKNVTFLQDSEKDVTQSKRCKIKQYFTEKVTHYKHQDIVAGRQWKQEDYVTADWIKEEFGQLDPVCCFLCSTPYETIVSNGNVTSNLTVDRIDNTKAHIKTNCRLCCVDCNRAKH